MAYIKEYPPPPGGPKPTASRYLYSRLPAFFGGFVLQVPSSQKKQKNQIIEFSLGFHCLVVLFLLLYAMTVPRVPTEGNFSQAPPFLAVFGNFPLFLLLPTPLSSLTLFFNSSTEITDVFTGQSPFNDFPIKLNTVQS